jgi:sugar phosphate isomerase/epimerase
MIGVSPAYILSACGPSFGPYDTLASLPLLAELGYEAFQAEVFAEELLDAWTALSMQAVKNKAAGLGLGCGVFVAHFMGSRFSTIDALLSELDESQTQKALTIGATLCPGGVFAVPLPPLDGAPNEKSLEPLMQKLKRLSAMTKSAGLTLALELMPGNALGGSRDFLKLCERPGFSELGLVFDTGHFWAMGEAPESLPALLGRRIVATHLCDNDGVRNLSLRPGAGTIAFGETLSELIACGYKGGLDLEIVCAREDVEREYGKAIGILIDLIAGKARLQGHTALSPR